MNIVDYVLMALLLAMVIVGSKKGLLRELTAMFTLIPAVIVSINFMDSFSLVVYEKVGGDPMVVTFLSFIILLGVAYAAFKIIGIVFAKMIKLQRRGRKDQMGGAFIGFMRGWVVISFVFFLLFLLPMPAGFYLSVQDSFFAPTLLKTVPFIFESSSPFHPKSPSFINKVESAMTLKSTRLKEEDRREVELVMMQIRRFFYDGLE